MSELVRTIGFSLPSPKPEPPVVSEDLFKSEARALLTMHNITPFADIDECVKALVELAYKGTNNSPLFERMFSYNSDMGIYFAPDQFRRIPSDSLKQPDLERSRLIIAPETPTDWAHFWINHIIELCTSKFGEPIKANIKSSADLPHIPHGDVERVLRMSITRLCDKYNSYIYKPDTDEQIVELIRVILTRDSKEFEKFERIIDILLEPETAEPSSPPSPIEFTPLRRTDSSCIQYFETAQELVELLYQELVGIIRDIVANNDV